MNTASILILLLVAAGVVLSIRHICKNRGKGCNGDCASCQKACKREEK